MKYFFYNLSANLVALSCVSIAGYLVINGKEGWGWFLFIGLLCAGTVTFRNKEN